LLYEEERERGDEEDVSDQTLSLKRFVEKMDEEGRLEALKVPLSLLKYHLEHSITPSLTEEDVVKYERLKEDFESRQVTNP
jgi:hypothetical protein